MSSDMPMYRHDDETAPAPLIALPERNELLSDRVPTGAIYFDACLPKDATIDLTYDAAGTITGAIAHVGKQIYAGTWQPFRRNK